MLQAGPAAVGEEAVAAVAGAKQLLQLIQRIAHRAGTREGTEVASGGALRAAVELEPRKLVLHVEVNVGKALVVAQHHVEARLVRLDQVVLEQQRLGLGVGHRDLDALDLCGERLHLGIDIPRGEVSPDAVPEAAGLADVEELVPGAEHAVHARPPGKRRDEFLGVELAHGRKRGSPLHGADALTPRPGESAGPREPGGPRAHRRARPSPGNSAPWSGRSRWW